MQCNREIELVVCFRGGDCNYNSFDFSGGHSYYTMSCKGPHVPQDYLYRTFPNQKIGTLVTNNRLTEDLLQKHLPKVFSKVNR